MGAATDGPSDVGKTPAAPTTTAFNAPKIGATLGRYQILGTLGYGAMATVFRARDPQLGRDVAVKVMGLAHAARGGASERFRREAHAVAALKHSGIVEIYDFVDATETEPSYIVAELIEGPTLRTLVETAGGRLLPEIAALIALPLTEALAVAHERGVVHRDVKPDNVMVESSGKGSRVVLTDFGIAHITGMETMTATGALVGSPAYMSPEQSRGHEVGPTADIWSVGTMLYEMVTGIVPFGGKDPYTVIAGILGGKFRPPSRVNACVGADLEAIVLRCLKRDPAERYATAAALAADLRAFTQAAGMVPEGEALRGFLDAPEEALRALRPRVADAAVARARQLVRRGQLARALAEIGHATAYVPDHAGAARLLKRLSASRTAIRIGVVLAGLAAAAGAVGVARPFLTGGGGAPSPTVGPTTPAGTALTPAPPPTPVPAPAPVPSTPTPTAAPTTVVAEPPGAPDRRVAPPKRRAPRSRSPVAVAEPETPASPPAPTAPPAPVVAPVPPPPPVEAAPKPGRVALFAKGGFCFPSLDDHPSADLMPVYRNVTPGTHRVYCRRTKGSPRELAGEVDVPAGGRIERTVTLQDGRLTIARPR